MFGKLQTTVVGDQTWEMTWINRGKCFPVNFVKFLRTPFSQNTFWRLLLNQVTNLKSLGFTWGRIANLLGVFPEVVLCDIYFNGFFDDAFDSHISSIVHFLVDCVAKLVLFILVTEADDSPAPTLRRSSLISPLLSLSTSCTGEQSS